MQRRINLREDLKRLLAPEEMCNRTWEAYFDSATVRGANVMQHGRIGVGYFGRRKMASAYGQDSFKRLVDKCEPTTTCDMSGAESRRKSVERVCEVFCEQGQR